MESSIEGIFFGLMFYFLPTVYAYYSDRKNVKIVFLINLTIGWTGIGWIGAFYAALTASKKDNSVLNK